MKEIIMIVISISFFAAVAKAQIKRESSPSQTNQNIQKKKNGKKMMKELNLSKQQRSQMKEFHQSMKQQKESLSNDNTLSDAQKQDKMKDLRKEQHEKMKSILTPEQIEKLNEQRKNMRMQPDVTNDRMPPVQNPDKK